MRLSIEHDFDALIAFNKQQTKSWFPLVPSFDPVANELTPENAFWIAGRDRDGEIVATQCARLFDWRGSNFKQEFESLLLVLPGSRHRAASRGMCVFGGALRPPN